VPPREGDPLQHLKLDVCCKDEREKAPRSTYDKEKVLRNTYDNNSNNRSNESEDEVVISAEPAGIRGAVTKRVHHGAHGYNYSRKPVGRGIIPARPWLLRLEHLHQHYVELESCRRKVG